MQLEPPHCFFCPVSCKVWTCIFITHCSVSCVSTYIIICASTDVTPISIITLTLSSPPTIRTNNKFRSFYQLYVIKTFYRNCASNLLSHYPETVLNLWTADHHQRSAENCMHGGPQARPHMYLVLRKNYANGNI